MVSDSARKLANSRYPGFVSRFSSLGGSAAWNVAGNLTNAAAQWGAIVLLAKLGDAAMVGQYALALAIAMPIVTFTGMQLSTVQASDQHGEYHDGDYLALRRILALLALVLVVAVVLVIGYSAWTSLAMIAVGAGKCVDAIGESYAGLFQRNERGDLAGKSLALKGILGLAAMGTVLAVTGELLWAALAWAVPRAGIIAWYDLRNAGRLEWGRAPGAGAPPLPGPRSVVLPTRGQATRLLGLIHVSWPLGLMMMLNALETSVPRYVIANLYGQAELGLFAAAAYFLQAGEVVARAVGEAATARLAKYHRHGDRRSYWGLVSVLVGMGVLMGAGGVLAVSLAGHEIMGIFYGAEYARVSDLLVWIMAAGLFIYPASFLSFGAFATRAYGAYTRSYLAVPVVAVVCSLVLIPAMGLLGAALTLSVTGAARCCASAVVAARVPPSAAQGRRFL